MAVAVDEEGAVEVVVAAQEPGGVTVEEASCPWEICRAVAVSTLLFARRVGLISQ